MSHWARAHWDNAPDPQPGFAQMVERDQVHMSSSTQADKLVYYGVDLGERGTLTATLAGWSPARPSGNEKHWGAGWRMWIG